MEESNSSLTAIVKLVPVVRNACRELLYKQMQKLVNQNSLENKKSYRLEFLIPLISEKELMKRNKRRVRNPKPKSVKAKRSPLMTCDARACRNKIEWVSALDSLINEDYDTSFRNTKAYKEWISSTPRADDLNDVINLEDEYYSLFFPGAFSLDDGYDRTLLAKHEVPVTHWNWLMQKYPKQPSPVEIPFANC